MTEDGETPQETEPFPSAEAVIDAFGGVRPMASRLGVAATTIQGWKSRGNIPENRRQEVRDKAAEAGVDLTALPAAPPTAETTSEEAPGEETPAEETQPEEPATTAAEPAPEPEPSPPPAAAPAPAPKSGGQAVAWLALLAAIAVGAALYTQPQWAPLVYGNGKGASTVPPEILSRLDALEAKPAPPSPLSLEPLTARVDALEAEVKALPAAPEAGPDLSPKLDDLTATVTQRGEQLDALSARLDQTTQALKGDMQSAAEATKSDIAALREEVASLKTALDDLRAREAAATGRTTGFALAVVSLEQAVRGGEPYSDALAAVQRLSGGNAAVTDAVATLSPDAATGIPTMTALTRQFEALVPRLGEPLWSDTGVSWADKILKKIDAVVSVRRIEDDSGKALPARQAEQAIAAGDLEAAVTALGPAPGPAADWVKAAKRRVAADKAVAMLRLQAVELLGKGLPAAGAAQ